MSKILDINAAHLHQLAKVLVKSSQDIQGVWSTIQDANLLAASFEEQLDTQVSKDWHYLTESIQVALIAATEMSLDLSTAVATILAPSFLTGLLQQEAIEKQFGKKTAAIVSALNSLQGGKILKDTICNYPTNPDINSPHILAILLQICNIIRLHCNGSSIESKEAEAVGYSPKLLRVLKHFYIPLSHRMRLYDIQTKLAEFWLKHADRLSYYAITAKLGMSKVQRNKKLALIAEEIYSIMQEHGIKFVMKKRIKSVYSIWHKIQKLKVDFHQIYDLSAIRIILLDMDNKTIVEEKIACWKIFTMINNLYKPIYPVMRDWISNPKDTGYESLHITFETSQYGQLEVQIRTERMDYIAEYGDAAHWKYKYNGLL